MEKYYPFEDIMICASNYTLNSALKFDRNDAIMYLYYNGALPLDAPRERFMRSVSKTTICMHIRLIYALSWHESKEVFYLILYCITDSKAVVGLLKSLKDGEGFDSGWWKQEQIKSTNPYSRVGDPFFDTKIPFKSKDINDDDVLAVKAFLYEERNLPNIYIAYRTLYEIFLSWSHHPYKGDLCIASLECAYLRYRLDRKVIEWESKYSG